MVTKIRVITDDECSSFTKDMAALDMDLACVISRYRALTESVWLGGSRDDGHTERGPHRTTKAMALVEQARDLLRQADHEVTMYRLGVSSADQGSGAPTNSSSCPQ